MAFWKNVITYSKQRAGELDDTRTHNAANELTARDTDSNGTDNFTLSYDAAGNMTDDGENYTYVYDPRGRLIEVKNRSNSNLVAEYAYDGLNRRTTIKFDSDTDGDVDASDTLHHLVYNERWQHVGTYRDSTHYELFVHHLAGMDGSGSSSYIDAVVLRDWDSGTDGTLDKRHYYCQNWRGDVVANVGVAGFAAQCNSLRSAHEDQHYRPRHVDPRALPRVQRGWPRS